MKPTLPKTTWMVWTAPDVYGNFAMTRVSWSWVAHGPHGSEAGVEESSQAAVAKAQSAAVVLADAREWNTANTGEAA